MQHFEIENKSLPFNAAGVVDTLDVETQRAQYLGTYAVIISLVLYLVIQRGALAIAVCFRASRHLHDALFRGILRAQMHFFHSNSSGRILNRFSKDIGHIDTVLVEDFYESVYVNTCDSYAVR